TNPLGVPLGVEECFFIPTFLPTWWHSVLPAVGPLSRAATKSGQLEPQHSNGQTGCPVLVAALLLWAHPWLTLFLIAAPALGHPWSSSSHFPQRFAGVAKFRKPHIHFVH